MFKQLLKKFEAPFMSSKRASFSFIFTAFHRFMAKTNLFPNGMLVSGMNAKAIHRMYFQDSLSKIILMWKHSAIPHVACERRATSVEVSSRWSRSLGAWMLRWNLISPTATAYCPADDTCLRYRMSGSIAGIIVLTWNLSEINSHSTATIWE